MGSAQMITFENGIIAFVQAAIKNSFPPPLSSKKALLNSLSAEVYSHHLYEMPIHSQKHSKPNHKEMIKGDF